ncbi:hypothetical protein M2480_000592 [Parabacteroides sp. PFB2-12]|uniref:hypothetical protein n=1 Tax=unclassified Parabacteroides TaxID=2649774 RepID=UPI00247316A5|nr:MULTISPECIES: hypothetical protein [unclassified Parabacteroides]MDH6341929.1 hypothetical protein [Parabacteroides sp. PM6-13]MDH6389627.1 hypothetical protein [Parabacteroides sp. PFB2-12]
MKKFSGGFDKMSKWKIFEREKMGRRREKGERRKGIGIEDRLAEGAEQIGDVGTGGTVFSNRRKWEGL